MYNYFLRKSLNTVLSKINEQDNIKLVSYIHNTENVKTKTLPLEICAVIFLSKTLQNLFAFVTETNVIFKRDIFLPW